MKQLASRALLSKVVAFNEIIIFLLFLVGWDWVHLVLRSVLACYISPRW
jgi:hypothetical protein